jgi:hypothetical protein
MSAVCVEVWLHTSEGKPKYSILLSLSRALCWTLAAFQFINLYTVGRTPWTGDQREQGLYLHTE